MIEALWLENGVIHAIGESFDEADFEQVFDAKGQLITPGLVDVHVHFREPGFTYKETIKTVVKLLLAVVLLRFAQCPI